MTYLNNNCQMNTTEPLPQNAISNWIMIIQAHCLNIVVVIGLVCNIISVIVFLCNPIRKKPFTVYHITLAVWDIILLANAMIALIIEKISSTELPQWISLVSYVAMNCSMNACIAVTIAATHERYIAVTRPMQRWGQHGLKRAAMTIVLISSICCIYNVPKYFELELYDDVDEDNCTVINMQPSWFRNVWWYLLFYRFFGGIIFGSVVPISCAVFMGVKVIRSVRSSASFQRLATQQAQGHIMETSCIVVNVTRFDQGEATTALLQPRCGRGNQRQSSAKSTVIQGSSPGKTPLGLRDSCKSVAVGSRQEKDVARMIVTHGIKFVVAYLLPTIIDTTELWIAIIGDGVIPGWFKYFVITGNFLVVFNSSSNILLYVCFCSAYRKSARQILRRLKPAAC